MPAGRTIGVIAVAGLVVLLARVAWLTFVAPSPEPMAAGSWRIRKDAAGRPRPWKPSRRHPRPRANAANRCASRSGQVATVRAFQAWSCTAGCCSRTGPRPRLRECTCPDEASKLMPPAEFTLIAADGGDDLTAWLAGHGVAVIERVATQGDVRAGRKLEVVLPQSPAVIEGWLVSADGTPASGWHLDLHGGATIVDQRSHPYRTAEDFAAGAAAQDLPPSHPSPKRTGAGGEFSVVPWAPGDPPYELGVSEEARWLSLEEDEGEIRRVPLVLRAGEVTTVQG